MKHRDKANKRLHSDVLNFVIFVAVRYALFLPQKWQSSKRA